MAIRTKTIKLSRIYEVNKRNFGEITLTEPTYADMVTDDRFFQEAPKNNIELALSYSGLTSEEQKKLAYCDVRLIGIEFFSFLDAPTEL
jgi:hypothetical protein